MVKSAKFNETPAVWLSFFVSSVVTKRSTADAVCRFALLIDVVPLTWEYCSWRGSLFYVCATRTLTAGATQPSFHGLKTAIKLSPTEHKIESDKIIQKDQTLKTNVSIYCCQRSRLHKLEMKNLLRKRQCGRKSLAGFGGSWIQTLLIRMI